MKCSLALVEDIEKHGGEPVMWSTGYTNVFAKRLETGAPFAGEFSGHMFFDDPIIDFDDGVYAGARLLEASATATNPSPSASAMCPTTSIPPKAAPMWAKRSSSSW